MQMLISFCSLRRNEIKCYCNIERKSQEEEFVTLLLMTAILDWQ